MSVAAYLLPLVSLLVGFRARAIGTWLGVMDQPDGARKAHSVATPLVGGLAVTAPFLMACARQLWEVPGIAVNATLMLAVGGAFLVGFFDDRRQIRAGVRTLVVIALVLVSLVIVPAFVVEHFNFSFLHETIALHPISVIFTILVVVGLMNAVNMADGINGLVCGLCLIWTGFLLFYAPADVVSILVLLAFVLFITLVFNLNGLLFLGDSGSYSLGMTISLLTVYIYNTTSGTLHADTVMVWFIVPVLDCLRLIVVRISQHRSPASPDTDHLHHRLRRLLPGWWALICYWMLVAVPGVLAIAIPSLALVAVLAVSGVYLGLIILTSNPGPVEGTSVPP